MGPRVSRAGRSRSPGSFAGAILAALLFVAPVAAQNAGPRGGLFVLPIARAWPVSESAGQLFEERIGIALSEAKRVRALSARDIPETQQRALPADLTTCLTPACLKRLGGATGAERVLGIKIADDGGRATLFATVFDVRSGAIVQRREWPGRAAEPELTPRLAAEVARWASGEPPAVPAPPVAAPVARAPVVEPGLLVFGLAPGEPASPQAQALLNELGTRLAGRPGFSLAFSEGPGTNPSHRAAVKIEQMSVRNVPHHLERRQVGTLAATLSITDLASGTVLFAARAQTSVSEKGHRTNDAEVMAGLVTEIVTQWMDSFDAQHTGEKIKRKGHS